LFTSNFGATCASPGVDWDLTSVVQKKAESLREFIIMFFKKGLRDPSLIHKLTMKNPRTSKTMFAIANNCALADEAILDTREQKKEKDSGHTDQPSSSKVHDKKRKVDHSVNVVE
jgi:hypothetical protein